MKQVAQVKKILDPSFRYTPSYATDVRKTFERIRQELQADRNSRPLSRLGNFSQP